MPRLLALLPRLPELDLESFSNHWATVHAAFALEIRALRKYVQNHRLEVEMPGLPSAGFDGVAEAWFEPEGAAFRLGEDPHYREGAWRDEANFMDLSRKSYLVTEALRELSGRSHDEGAYEEERRLVLFGAPRKAMVFAKRSTETPVGDFRREFAAIMTAATEALDAAECRSSVTSDLMYESSRTPSYDGVGEYWWSDPTALQDAFAGTAYQTHVDALHELTAGQLGAVMVREVPMRWPGLE